MAKQPLTFKKAVETTPDIANGYTIELTALGQYASRINATDVCLLNGSVDIDTCTRAKYPNDNRWDYTLAYNQKVYFVEVHSAKTNQVSKVLKKLQWLKDWLNFNAPEIKKLKAEQPYYWIMSKNNQISGSSKAREIAQTKLKLVKLLELK